MLEVQYGKTSGANPQYCDLIRPQAHAHYMFQACSSYQGQLAHYLYPHLSDMHSQLNNLFTRDVANFVQA